MVMTLPAKPSKLGEICRVLASSIAAVAGEPNSLQLGAKRMICVVLVDGLGYHNLERRRGHAPNLSSQSTTKSYTVFPSTTAAALTSLATGELPGEHGILAHVAHDSTIGTTKNLLSGWDNQQEALTWKVRADLSEQQVGQVEVFNVSASEYRDTGFTALSMSRANFVAADSMQDRFITAVELLKDRRNRGVIYLYVQELDQAGHRHGWESPQWSELLEDLDRQVGQLANALPSDCGVVVTADHGQIDSPLEERHELKSILPSQLIAFAGDSRATFLHLKRPEDAPEIASFLGEAKLPAQVIATNQLIDAGWFGLTISHRARWRLPDLVLLANGQNTLFHSDFSKQRSYLMTGHHGGLTEQELAIPLVRIGF